MQCPICGAGMQVKSGQHGDFYGCDNFRTTGCRGTRKMDGSVPQQQQGPRGSSPPSGGGKKQWDSRVEMSVKEIASLFKQAIEVAYWATNNGQDHMGRNLPPEVMSAKETSVFIALMEQAKYGKLRT